MKNKIIFSTLIILAFIARAQNITYDHDATVTGAIETIVRSWGNTRSVSYYWVGDQPYLDVTTMGGGPLYRVEMPVEITIKDMFVDQSNGHLYFCGTTATPYQHLVIGEGVLGCLDLYTVTQSSNINIHWTILSSLSVVTKLVEYNNGGPRQVAAIGIRYWQVAPYTYSEYYFVECGDASSNLPGTTYARFTANERYDDIVLTDHYVVCLGHNADPSINGLCYRKANRTNIYDPIINDIHYFTCINEVFSATHTTSLNFDNIITSYLYVDIPTSYSLTHLRTIDVDNDVMTHSQEYLQVEKSEPTAIVFFPDDTSAVIMHDYKQNGTYNSNFIHIEPFPSQSYSTIIDYMPNVVFKSLTTHSTKYYLAGNGASWFYRDKLFAYYGPNCPNIAGTKLLMLDNLVHSRISSPLPAPIPAIYKPDLQGPVSQSTSSYICQH